MESPTRVGGASTAPLTADSQAILRVDASAVEVGSGSSILVGPDNGVFTAFLARAEEVREIREAALFLPEVSATFHGRDVFAPVAAQTVNEGATLVLALAATDPDGDDLTFTSPGLAADHVDL